MRQYERYIFLHLLWPTLAITASLTGIIWLTQILKFLDFILSRGLSIGDFLSLTGLMIPSLLLVLTPISLCIAVIYTYNRLMVESELTVLNAVGISTWQLARPAATIGLACMLLCYLLSLFLMPLANAEFQDVRIFFRDKYSSVLLEEEVFNNPVDGVTVFVRERDNHNNFLGILMHDTRDPTQSITMLADSGSMEKTPSGPRFHLHNGMRQQWQKGQASWLKFDDYAVDISFYGHDGTRQRSPEERSIFALFQHDGLTNKQINAYRIEAHQRLTWPLLALSLPLAVLAILFSSEFNRRGQLRRILMAAVSMVLLTLVYFMIRSLSLKHHWMIPGLYLLTSGIGVISYQALAYGRWAGTSKRLPSRLTLRAAS